MVRGAEGGVQVLNEWVAVEWIVVSALHHCGLLCSVKMKKKESGSGLWFVCLLLVVPLSFWFDIVSVFDVNLKKEKKEDEEEEERLRPVAADRPVTVSVSLTRSSSTRRPAGTYVRGPGAIQRQQAHRGSTLPSIPQCCWAAQFLAVWRFSCGQTGWCTVHWLHTEQRAAPRLCSLSKKSGALCSFTVALHRLHAPYGWHFSFMMCHVAQFVAVMSSLFMPTDNDMLTDR